MWKINERNKSPPTPDNSARRANCGLCRNSRNRPRELCDDVRAFCSSLCSSAPAARREDASFLGHSARELHIPHKLEASRVAVGTHAYPHRMEGTSRTETGEPLGTSRQHCPPDLDGDADLLSRRHPMHAMVCRG